MDTNDFITLILAHGAKCDDNWHLDNNGVLWDVFIGVNRKSILINKTNAYISIKTVRNHLAQLGITLNIAD